MNKALAEILEACEATDARTEVLASPPGVDVILAVSMPEERSFDRWQAMDARAGERGYVALGVGSDRDLNGLREQLALPVAQPFESFLTTAQSLDVAGWLSERESEVLDDLEELPDGEWSEPGSRPQAGFEFPFDEVGNHLDPWWLVLVPAAERWMAALSLAYGGWNDCPGPEVHAALCRYWAETYGARLVGVGHDVLEFMVEAPPTERASAIALAKQHYLYCPDTVEQGTETISRLAANLMQRGTWHFWWD